MCNSMYRSGQMINDFKHGIVVTKKKKKGTMKCEERGTLDFISHVSVCLLFKIMETRIDRATSFVLERYKGKHFII